MNNRHALITGAGAGIGAAIAQVMASEGAQVICLDVPQAQEALQQALASLDPDTLSPREALDALYQLKKLQL